MLYDSIMDRHRTMGADTRGMLYDVISELCAQLKELRNEIVELQHAIHNLNDQVIG